MKVTLISHHLEDYGPRILAAQMVARGHEVRRVVLSVDHFAPLGEVTLQAVIDLCEGADLIGHSVYTNNFSKAVQVACALKASHSAPLLWGGPHPTTCPEESIGHAEAIFLGEAEESLPAFLDRFAAEGALPVDVRGTWVRRDGQVHRNLFPAVVTDLDGLPFPHYDFNAEFLVDEKGARPLTAEAYHQTIDHYMAFPTRGCPHQCSYCINNLLGREYPGRTLFRQRSMAGVIEEMAGMMRLNPGLKWMILGDDAFMGLPLAKIKAFCEGYKREIRLPLFVTGATPSTVTAERMDLLMDAGMTRIRMGIQSGSDRTRRLYRRTHTKESVVRAAEILSRYADRLEEIDYDIIIDNPWESMADRVETLRMLAGFKPKFSILPYSLTYYPGTELYEKAVAEGRITGDYEYPFTFYSFENTYLNRLLLTLRERVLAGRRLRPWLIDLLTAPSLQRNGLAQIIYSLLLSRKTLASHLAEAGYLMRANWTWYRRLTRWLVRNPDLKRIGAIEEVPRDGDPFYIYGTGRTAEAVLKLIKQYNVANVAGFIDSTVSGSFHGYEVSRFEDFRAASTGNEVILIASQCVDEIYSGLRAAGPYVVHDAYPLFQRFSNRLLLPGWSS